jgi:hypothetical protein
LPNPAGALIKTSFALGACRIYCAFVRGLVELVLTEAALRAEVGAVN